MRGINKVILVGTVGDEPTLRRTQNGNTVANISMVTNEFRRSESGEPQEFAEWHRVVLWSRLAETAAQYVHKGSQLYIEGKLRTRSYMDKQNQKRYITEIVADDMQMLGGRPQSAASGAPYRQPQEPRTFGQSGGAAAPVPPVEPPGNTDDGDDIPF